MRPNMNPTGQYQVHVTDEWEWNTMVIQVRAMARNETTHAIAQVMEDDRDGMPTVYFQPISQDHEGREHLVPTPGIRIAHDVAVAMARAILTEAGKDADEVERLKGAVADLQHNLQATLANERALATKSMALEDQVAALERLVEAKDAHLEREARTADHWHTATEHGQRDADREQAERHHPRLIMGNDALDEAARSVMDAYRGVKVKRSDLEG